MPRNAAISIENDFSRGLITEFSPIAFPEKAATEIWDIDMQLDRKLVRRQGFEFEVNHGNRLVDRDLNTVRSFLWKNVLGDGTLDLLVLQVGTTLYFYKAEDPVSTSDNALATTVDLTTYAASGAPSAESVNCHFASGDGKLFVTHPHLDAIYVTYDSSSETVTATQIDPEIRDFEGVTEDPSLDIDERPTASKGTLSTSHQYNLWNQGWYFNEGSSGPIDAWDTARSDMPSNADAWWYYTDSNGDWNNNQLSRFNPGNTPAPKGHYILNVFEENRTSASGISGITTVSTGGARFTTSAFFAGRKFYSGIKFQGYGNKIYFSQIIEDDDQIGRCYQRNDPATEDFFDLVASDGGVINIPDAGDVVKLFVIQQALLVFTTLGIWAITGSADVGFAANDFVVSKLSDIPTLSALNFVSVEGLPMWWNEDGIYILATSEQGGFQINNLTAETIKSFYDTIPLTSKKFAKGAYNRDNRTVQWLYQSAEQGDVDGLQEYDRILNYNVQFGAFHPWTIGSSDTKVHDIFVIEGTGGDVTVNQVTSNSGADTVQDGSGNNVVTFSLADSVVKPKFKYLVSTTDGAGSYNFTFAETRITDYNDWSMTETTGVDYSSYLISGYRIRGELMRHHQANYIQVFFDKEDDASCILQGLWDWAATGASGKFSSTQQAYTTRRNNFEVVFRRLKIRGKGRSLQIKLSSEAGKPFTLLGWSAFETANAGL